MNSGAISSRRIVYGARISLLVGLVAVSISTVAGTFLGMIAGFSIRALDEIIMRVMDILYAFPFSACWPIAIVAIVGKGFLNVMIALGVVYTPIFARIARASVLGSPQRRIHPGRPRAGRRRVAHRIFTHVMPNILSPIIVEITLSLAFAILTEAGLSFFSLGVQPPTPSWGRMLAEGRDYLHQSSLAADLPRPGHHADRASLQLPGRRPARGARPPPAPLTQARAVTSRP